MPVMIRPQNPARGEHPNPVATHRVVTSHTIAMACIALVSTVVTTSQAKAADRDGRVSAEYVESIAMPTDGTVSIERTWGDVRVEASDEAAVSVRVTARSKAAFAAQDTQAATRDIEGFRARIVRTSPTRVTITALSPNTRSLKRFGGKRGIALTYTITMPRTAGLALRHGVGSVEVAALASDVDVAAKVGDIRIATPRDTAVSVTASATIGDVSVARRAGAGSYRSYALLGHRYSDAPMIADSYVVARVKVGSVEVD